MLLTVVFIGVVAVIVVVRVQHFVFVGAVMADIGGVQRLVLVLLFVFFFLVFAIGRFVVPFERGHDQFDDLGDKRDANVSIREHELHSDSFVREPCLRDLLHRNRCPSDRSSLAGTCSHLS